MNVDKAVYLGDGAYASVDELGDDIAISANHHESMAATATVYLTPEALRKLISFAQKHGMCDV